MIDSIRLEHDSTINYCFKGHVATNKHRWWYSFSNNKEKVYSLQYNALKASLEHHTQKMYEYAQKIQQLEKEF